MKRRGLTLIEAMLSLLLLGMALAAIAVVVRQASAIGAFSGGKDRSLQAAQLALVRMRDESLQALEWLAPNSTATVNEVRFRRLSPLATVRFPQPAPPAPWDPVAESIEVVWQVQGEILVRTAATERLELARAVPLLEARFLQDGQLELALNVREKERVARWMTRTTLVVGR